MLVAPLIESFYEEDSIMNNFHFPPIDVLNQVLNSSPSIVWKIVKKYIGPPIDSRAFNLGLWLRGNIHHTAEGEDHSLSQYL